MSDNKIDSDLIHARPKLRQQISCAEQKKKLSVEERERKSSKWQFFKPHESDEGEKKVFINFDRKENLVIAIPLRAFRRGRI